MKEEGQKIDGAAVETASTNDNSTNTNKNATEIGRAISAPAGNNTNNNTNVAPQKHNNSSTAAAVAQQPRIVVARPPINDLLRIAIIRTDKDEIICEDPEHPGKKKKIVIDTLLNNNSGGQKGDKVEGGESKPAFPGSAVKQQQEDKEQTDHHHHDNNNNNKVEIPVPTITTVKKYDVDIPPTYTIPPSYVRHVCPTYNEISNTIEYNVDDEDEHWWKTNKDFGPFARAKIIIPGEEPDNTTNNGENGGREVENAAAPAPVIDTTTTKEASKKKKQPKKKRGRKKKLVKKSSSSKSLDSMDIETTTDSDVSVPPTTIQPSASGEDAALHSQPNNERSTSQQQQSKQKYNLTIQQVLLLNPKYLHSRYSTLHLLQKYNPKLPLALFEQMIDILEKLTGSLYGQTFHAEPITVEMAQQVLVEKLPQLVTIFGPLSATDRKLIEEEDERYLQRWINTDNNEAKKQANNDDDELPPPELKQPITLPAVIKQIYTYWVSKRTRLKKSLLRRYWTPTTTDSFDPKEVFRQRDKEKRRLRKKKQNDIEAYKKMRLLKLDFERVKVLCDLIIQRERVNGTMVELTNGYFEERLGDLVDASGSGSSGRRRSQGHSELDRNRVESVLNGIPRYFDDGPIVRVKGNKKRKRSSQTQLGWNVDSRETSPVPYGSVSSGSGAMATAAAAGSSVSNNQTMATNLAQGMKQQHPPPPSSTTSDVPTDKKFIAAGHDYGLPAPNFLQPLATRESYNVSSDQTETVPSIPSYINGRPTTHSHKFRHRPRLGRGGRIMIDRVPLPSSTSYVGNRPGRSDSPPTVVTYGTPMTRSGYDADTLGADGPNYNVGMSPPAGRRSLEGVGTNAKTAPKVPPAQQLMDLLPRPLDNQTVALSRKIEEICALGLLEDYKSQSATSYTHATSASSVAASSNKNSGSGNTTAPSAAAAAAATAEEEEDTHEVLVPIEDWMEAPEALNIYGSERYVIGPL